MELKQNGGIQAMSAFEGEDNSNLIEVQNVRDSHKSLSDFGENRKQEDVDCHILRDIPSFVKSISHFFNNESFSDVSIKVGATLFKAHKFILAKSSRVFQTMLYGEAWSLPSDVKSKRNNFNCSPAELLLEETPECEIVFDKFLKYLYSAEIVICNYTAVGILCLADKYEVNSLKHLCMLYMVEWAKSPRVQNALLWYNWAKMIGLKQLIGQCFKTIAWNFSEVISGDDWVKMDIDFLIDFLSSSELVIKNEFMIYEALLKWLNSDLNRGSFEKNCQLLLPLVRFPQMYVSQLYQLEKSNSFSSENSSKLLSDLFSRAYRFRAVCPNQTNLGANFNDDYYLPRDYTSLIVDNVRIQNTVRFGIQSDVKASRSPVPSELKDADWKITYRKQGEIWSIQLYCLDSALINGETRVQVSILVYNEQDQVIKVSREETKGCGRGGTITMATNITCEPAKSMALILKPIAL